MAGDVEAQTEWPSGPSREGSVEEGKGHGSRTFPPGSPSGLQPPTSPHTVGGRSTRTRTLEKSPPPSPPTSEDPTPFPDPPRTLGLGSRSKHGVRGRKPHHLPPHSRVLAPDGVRGPRFNRPPGSTWTTVSKLQIARVQGRVTMTSDDGVQHLPHATDRNRGHGWTVTPTTLTELPSACRTPGTHSPMVPLVWSVGSRPLPTTGHTGGTGTDVTRHTPTRLSFSGPIGLHGGV